MQCKKCGKENPPDSAFCCACGSRLSDPPEAPVAPVQTNADKLVWKFICLIGGILGVGYGLYTVHSDLNSWQGYNYQAYDYRSPLNEHETLIVFMIVISILIFIVGCGISSKDKKE